MTAIPAMSDEEERAAFTQWWKQNTPDGNFEDWEFQIWQAAKADERSRQAALAGEKLTIADYEASAADTRRLVRELGVLLNGEGSAAQPSLCDIVAQMRHEKIRGRALTGEPSEQDIERVTSVVRKKVELMTGFTLHGYEAAVLAKAAILSYLKKD